MNAVESFLLNCGCSWTWSKLFPYLLFPVLGLLIGLLLRKRLRRKWLRYTMLLVLPGLLFGAYFSCYPIYEGDFSNNSVTIRMPSELKQSDGYRLTVITIPGCPFCMESIARMKRLKAHHPAVRIEYRVCSSHPEDLKAYRTAAGGAFPVVLATDMHELADVSGYAFPAFVLTDEKTAVKWSNNAFGVAALDEVEGRVAMNNEE